MSEDPDTSPPVLLARAKQLFAQARRSLVDSNEIDEVLPIERQAEVIQAAAHAAHDRGLQADAIEVMWLAQIRLGQLIEMQGDAGLLNKGGGPGRGKTGVRATPDLNAPPTLKELGIDKNLAKKARLLAALSKEEFDRHVFALHDRAQLTNKPLPVFPFAKKRKPRHTQRPDPTFEFRVQQEVEKQLKERIAKELPEYQKRLDEYNRVIAAHEGVFWPDDLNKIISCLHPDGRINRTEAEWTEAFRLIFDNREALRKHRKRPLPLPSMSELAARRSQQQHDERQQREARKKAKAKTDATIGA